MVTGRQDAATTGPARAHRHVPTSSESDLRAAGLRVTAPRLAVLGVLGERQHADADTIAAGVRERLGAVSRQAVYDVLHALTHAGLVRRISVDERRSRYELHRHDNHHHLVCRVCGRIEDVPCAVGAAPCLELDAARGFDVEEADVVFRGLCTACRTEPATAASARPPQTPVASDR